MILYEYEGKKLLKVAGIGIPKSFLADEHGLNEIATSLVSLAPRNDRVVLKAQVLSGKRAESGGIISIKNQELSIKGELEKLFKKTIKKEKIEKILVEEMVEYEGPEYYVSISYDTEARGPILTISSSGGTGVEEKEVQTFAVDPLIQTVIATPSEARGKQSSSGNNPTKIASSPSAPRNDEVVHDDIIQKLIHLFFDQDLLLLEINPLVKVKSNRHSGLDPESQTKILNQVQDDEYVWVALDAKVKLDDSAASRHEDPSTSSGQVWNFPPRSAPGHTPTKNEIEAKKIDEGDYRGVAGSTYFDLDGDIAVLSSGGGVSLTAMDALIKEGGKPANFTEYSGNPPKEKVVKLTKVVLNKPNIHGLWVIGTVAANFTDIYETLSGFVEGLRELKSQGIKLDFPIVIRRGGPRDKEAFEMLRGVKDFNLILQSEETSIAESAKVMADLAKKYATSS